MRAEHAPYDIWNPRQETGGGFGLSGFTGGSTFLRTAIARTKHDGDLRDRKRAYSPVTGGCDSGLLIWCCSNRRNAMAVWGLFVIGVMVLRREWAKWNER